MLYILPFFKMISYFTDTLDAMIEAKQKDRAALKLIDELQSVRGFNVQRWYNFNVTILKRLQRSRRTAENLDKYR